MNGSSPTYGATRLRRPPVCVSAPVSTSVTRHGSTVFWWTSMSWPRRSNVTSELCRK